MGSSTKNNRRKVAQMEASATPLRSAGGPRSEARAWGENLARNRIMRPWRPGKQAVLMDVVRLWSRSRFSARDPGWPAHPSMRGKADCVITFASCTKLADHRVPDTARDMRLARIVEQKLTKDTKFRCE